MAHNREWDRGKDHWQNDTDGTSGAWYPGPDGGGRRGREEDYGSGGDLKRRKFDDGGYDSTQGWDNNTYNASYYGQQAQAQAQATSATYGGGPSAAAAPYYVNKKRMIPSEPSCHVIFLGLDTDFTEADLHAYLTQHGCLSKGFGFAQFSTLESARQFVDPSFPFIQVPPPASHGASASAQFWKALETGAPHTGRRVKIDYSQSANPNDKKRPGQGNDGTRDIGNSPAAVLLFRGLDPLSGPQAILQAMKTSSGLHKEGAKGMKRIILIKDKTTLASWGFAFVEFIDTQVPSLLSHPLTMLDASSYLPIKSASAVLAATMSPQIHPNGFRISDKPVAASFAHPYSFQPIENQMMRDEACMQSSMALGGVEGVWVRYWDEGTTAAILEFKVEEPVPAAAPIKEKKKKLKVTDADLTPLAPEASTLPVLDKPVTLNIRTSFVKKGPAAPAKAGVGVFALNDEVGDDGGVDEEKAVLEDAKVAAAKRVAPMIASKKTANNISKWNQAQEVITSASAGPAPLPPSSNTTNVQVVAPKKVAQPASTDPSPPPETEFEFSDVVKLTCLLCARQFKTLEQLSRHNKESDLHKKNYKDATLRDIARKKAQAVKENAVASEVSSDAQQAKYRDRASERRIMHNQPDVPLPEGMEDKRKQRRFIEGPPPPPSPPPPPVKPGEDPNNVGNKLLKMMGWKEGTGLGIEGEGRVDPIQTALYASGAGLGASKGKEVGKYQDGYAGYVSMAKDAARERYDA
ncbi:hypothetical protein K488DRAFT_85104 [Vararia minispora EC-137]|uniref:Uncharacterized protein n=1 Tax=Vararia minispora EC-137 TaxID=1314806 RepID=A0ACB8QN30_9AGAM|nr:hypothetical protein K488DRAFT_85104 [Vararia minispora EC-137]